MQIWKDIKGFEGLYQVSNLGRVRRKLKHDKWHYTFGGNANGYKQVELWKDKKPIGKFGVHDLVVEAFVRKFDREKEECHHVNHIRSDNRLENLQILTKSEHRSNDKQTARRISKSNTGKKLSHETIAKRTASRKANKLLLNK